MANCKFTTSLITDKSNQVRGLIDFETLVNLAKCPDEIDNHHLEIYQLIQDGKVDSDKLSHNIRLTQSNGWANCAGLKCSIDKLQSDYLGTKTRNDAKITTEIIDALKAQEQQGFYSLLFADIDHGNLTLEAVKARVDYFIHKIKQQQNGSCYLVYATKSSQPHNKKWRVVVPLQGIIKTREFIVTQAILCKILGGDVATTKPYQAFMLPLTYNNDYMARTDYEFFFHEFNGRFLHAVEIQESPLILKLMEKEAVRLNQRINIPTNRTVPRNESSVESLPTLFNAQADLLNILQCHDYRAVKDKGNKVEMALPNKTDSKANAYLYKDTNTFHTFNTNDVLYNGSRSITAYEALKRLEFNNNDSEAYRKIANSKEFLNIDGMTYNEFKRASKKQALQPYDDEKTLITQLQQ